MSIGPGVVVDDDGRPPPDGDVGVAVAVGPTVGVVVGPTVPVGVAVGVAVGIGVGVGVGGAAITSVASDAVSLAGSGSLTALVTVTPIVWVPAGVEAGTV